MDLHAAPDNHRKRKRRRAPQRSPISANLVLDSHLKGDVGVLSEDLLQDLFPDLAAQWKENDAPEQESIIYVAVAPQSHSPFARSDVIAWTVLPVTVSSDPPSSTQTARSSFHFPASSPTLNAFAQHLQKTSTNIARVALQGAIDIFILDVVPIGLETVVVSVDDVALEKLDDANKKFHNRFPNGKAGSLRRGQSAHGAKAARRWEKEVREALASQPLLHAGDLISLPVATHPITHTSAPPAILEVCEPVAQGLLTPQTKIVLISSTARTKKVKALAPPSPFSLSNGIKEEDEADDTANEQFYSAAEEKPAARQRRSSVDMQEPTDAETSNDDDDDAELSDGGGDTIGLSLPSLSMHSAGAFSSFASATPGLGGLNGIGSPGSVISGYSMSTVMGGGTRGKLFEAHGLYMHVPDDALHPKPSSDEDAEARIFVDTMSLVKLGCFSGDWVRIEAAPDEQLSTLGSWGIGAFDTGDDDAHEWRVAKIYAMPGQSGQRQRYAIDKRGSHRLNRSLMNLNKAAPKVYVSPVTLANLDSPSHLRIASLGPSQARRPAQRTPFPASRITNASAPPVAKDVTLRKFSTPVAHERQLDTSIFLGLEKYFKRKQRCIKTGDLIGVPFDESLGRAMYQGTAAEEDPLQKELLSASAADLEASAAASKPNVAWFKVSAVTTDEDAADSPWGGLATVKPETTRISQAGDEHGKLPDAMASSWRYYLGVARLPSVPASMAADYETAIGKPNTFLSPTRRRLRELISAATSPQAIHMGLPPLAILLVSTQRHIGKATLAARASMDLGLHTFSIDAYDILSEGGAGGGDVNTAALLEARAERGLVWCGSEYTTLLLRHVETLTADRMSGALKTILSKCRVLIATTTQVDKVPEGTRSLFTHEIEVSAPDEGERQGLLQDIIQETGVAVAPDVDLSQVAVKTAALVAGDLVDVVSRALVAQQARLEALAAASNESMLSKGLRATLRDVQMAGGEASRCVTRADFEVAVEHARKNFADSIGAPKIPNVGWNDVGGLSNVKDAVMETIQLPLERPELFAKGMKKRSGILFYGPPGTGKTLLAKAIATEFSLNFFSVKGPELLNMYIGESEANVRRVFQRARDARPCVVFFDELDSVAPKRGNQGDSGGVMDRIVSQLLAELDGMSAGEDGGGGVFVIGATNRPDLLDQALLRPGRFDKMLYLGVSDTHEKQLTILEALTRKFALSPSLSLPRVAETLPFTYTGADLYALCSDAMLKAITRKASAVDAKVKSLISQARRALTAPKSPTARSASAGGDADADGAKEVTVAYFFDHLATPHDTEVVVEHDDFMEAQKELVPSVSAKELEHYDRVRQTFERDEERKEAAAREQRLKSKQLAEGKSGALEQGMQGMSLNGNISAVAFTEANGNGNGNGIGIGNGYGGGRTVSKTKGKGKAAAVPDGFGEVGEEDEEMYA